MTIYTKHDPIGWDAHPWCASTVSTPIQMWKSLPRLEFFNPTHSVKDRIAVSMVDDAEARGILQPGKHPGGSYQRQHRVSGLANVCAAARGYKSVDHYARNGQYREKAAHARLGCRTYPDPCFRWHDGCRRKSDAIAPARPALLAWLINSTTLPTPTSTALRPVRKSGETPMDGSTSCGRCGHRRYHHRCRRSFPERNPALEIIAVEPSASPVLSRRSGRTAPAAGHRGRLCPLCFETGSDQRSYPGECRRCFRTTLQLRNGEGIPGGIPLVPLPGQPCKWQADLKIKANALS